jgi:hypothetical protein
VQQFTVTLLGMQGGYTIPSPSFFTFLVGQVFAVTAYALADYSFTQWRINGMNEGAANPLTITGVYGVAYTVQPTFTPSPGDPAQEPPPSEVPPPVIPPSSTELPPAATAIGDAKRFTQLVSQLAASRPPTMDVVWRQLQRVQPPNLERVFRILEHVS